MITTAIILAGGFGTRLKAVVPDVPKPMAEVNHQPFLSYQLKYLKHYGFKNIIISTGYLAEKISSFYEDEFAGMSIVYSHEDKALGTGGGIRLAIEKCSEKDVLVLNGDSFFDVNLQDFYRLHQEQKAEASLAMRRVENASRYGTILIGENNRIISFREKNGKTEEGIINGGTYILNKDIYLRHTPGLVPFSIEKDFFEKKLDEVLIKGFEFNTYFIDIGIPEDYNKAQHDFKRFKY